jgi:hypothetical protein
MTACPPVSIQTGLPERTGRSDDCSGQWNTLLYTRYEAEKGVSQQSCATALPPWCCYSE